MKIGDMVRYKGNPNSVPCLVLEVKDLGHGQGYERVKIRLPILGLTRCFARCELEVVEGEE